jgi:hypothetical protein
MNPKQKELQVCVVLLNKMKERAEGKGERVSFDDIHALNLENKRTLDRLGYAQLATEFPAVDPWFKTNDDIVKYLISKRVVLEKAILLSSE